MKFSDPKQVGGEVLDFAGFVVLGQFLFVVIKTGGKTTFGVFVHFVGPNLKFDDAFVFSDDGSMNGLVAVLFGHGNVILNTAAHRHVKGVDNAENQITVGDVVYDDAEGG